MIEDRLASKRDLSELEMRLRADMNNLRAELRETELRLKHDLTLRLGGMMAASIAIVAALVKLPGH